MLLLTTIGLLSLGAMVALSYPIYLLGYTLFALIAWPIAILLGY